MDTVGMAGEWLKATANANMFTYETSPVFILMEAWTKRVKSLDFPMAIASLLQVSNSFYILCLIRWNDLQFVCNFGGTP